VTLERRLEAAIHGAAAALANLLTENEFSERSPTEIAICHRLLEFSVRQPRHHPFATILLRPSHLAAPHEPETPADVVGVLVVRIALSVSVETGGGPTLWLQTRWR